MAKQEKSKGEDAPADSPTAWFAVLERARRTNDYALAAQAQRELVRLGVVVKFPAMPSRKGGGDAR
jgi:hypothetical protein